jgi:nitroreductase
LVLCYDLGADVNRLTEHEYQEKRDAAMTRAGLVAQQMMISASRLGIDSCPMIGFDYEEVGKLLRKADSDLLLMILALGKRREEPPARALRLAVKDIVAYNAVRI